MLFSRTERSSAKKKEIILSDTRRQGEREPLYSVRAKPVGRRDICGVDREGGDVRRRRRRRRSAGAVPPPRLVPGFAWTRFRAHASSSSSSRRAPRAEPEGETHMFADADPAAPPAPKDRLHAGGENLVDRLLLLLLPPIRPPRPASFTSSRRLRPCSPRWRARCPSRWPGCPGGTPCCGRSPSGRPRSPGAPP